MRSCTSIFALGLLTLAGCTSLQTMPDNFRTERRGDALAGFPYALPMRQFDLDATWTLTDCANRPLTAADTKPPRTTITAALEATPLMAPGERYLVDYRALGGPLKTTDFTIETYPEGTLKAVNAVADDRSGETLVAAVKTAASLATFLPNPPPPPPPVTPASSNNLLPPPPPPTFRVECTNEAIKLLGTAAAAATALKALTAQTKDVAARVEQLALAGMLDPAMRTALAGKLEELRKLGGAIDAAKKALADARAPLQVRGQHRWPDDFSIGGASSTGLRGEPTEDFFALFKIAPTGTNIPDPDCLSGVAKDSWKSCVADRAVQHVRLQPALDVSAPCAVPLGGKDARFGCTVNRPKSAPVDPGQNYTPKQWADYESAKAVWKATSPVSARDARPDKGLFVRPPEHARLVSCHRSPDCDPTSDDAVKVGDWLMVPQLGQLRFLPFENRMFENNALVLALSKDGTVEKFQYATKAAIAERLATSASSVADALTGGRKSWRDERAARRAEKLAALDQQIALAEKSGKVAALGAPAVPASVEEEAEQAQRIALKLEIEIEDRLVEASSDD